ncbi:MAG: uroporphyrinogen-III synthase [Bacteroidales bacterium]|nr:uroporphyrinogen-III synthase [Bacteroidales bacterium]
MKILISQHAPTNPAPYEALQKSYGVKIDFIPFFEVEPLTDKEFRTQRINLPDYTAVVFSSRLAIDAYFKLCEDMRFKVPETMKYFCTTEAVAMYLQKHIVYRKRKIFYGDGTPSSVAGLIGAKHKSEKFLIASGAGSNMEPFTSLFDKAGLDYTVGVFVKSVSQDLHSVDIPSYDVVVMCNQSDVKSLQESYPDFDRNCVKFITFGKSIVAAMTEAGFPIEIQAPTPEAMSVAKALEIYLQTRK